MKPPLDRRTSADPDPLFRIEVEKPLAGGGRFRVVSSLPQRTVWIVFASTAAVWFGWPAVTNMLTGLSVLRRLIP